MSARGGIGGHQSAAADSETWLTPPGLLGQLGEFDLDPCAAPEPRPWPTAAEHWTRADSPLNRPWHGRVWLNPPYGGPHILGPWMRRMAEHGKGTALIFARTETAVFFSCVWDRSTAIKFIAGRLTFHRADGTLSSFNSGAPSCLIAYGLSDAKRLRATTMPGKFIDLLGGPAP